MASTESIVTKKMLNLRNQKWLGGGVSVLHFQNPVLPEEEFMVQEKNEHSLSKCYSNSREYGPGPLCAR